MEGILGGELCFLREAPTREVTPMLAHESGIRVAGDALHVFASVLLLVGIVGTRNVRGVSVLTQEVQFVVFVTRYLNPLHGQEGRPLLSHCLFQQREWMLLSMQNFSRLTIPELSAGISCHLVSSSPSSLLSADALMGCGASADALMGCGASADVLMGCGASADVLMGCGASADALMGCGASADAQL
ncbi:hypothetical protein CYMTET_33302, partial [Cymbomonas tetramitiformis]